MKTNFKAKKIFNLTRPDLTKQARMRVVLTAFICGAFGNAQALPFGEQVQAGNLSFERGAQFLNINQTSQKAIANWQSFSIAVNESVRLNQPAQGVALFRVIGNDPSQIFGSLSATGDLFLSNPNGVLFGRNAQVDVGSLVATSMRINDSNFLAGNYQFHADGNAAVINEGVIRTEDGGYIALLGNAVENNGTLQANNGSVILGSAQSAMLDFYGDGLVRVKLDGDALNVVIKQTGNITADGGAVQLATNARTAAINVDGVIQANSLVERNGVIRLEGGKNSTVLISGKLEASGKTANTKGGNIAVTGERVALLDGTSIDVSGNLGGGEVLIGGDYQGKNTAVQNAEVTFIGKQVAINADAIDSGDGGKIVVWANDTTRFYGNASARGGNQSGDGGFVEVSGKETLVFKGDVDTRANNGNTGLLFLDPANITISNGTGDGNDLDVLNNSFAGGPSAGLGAVLAADTSPTTMFESELQGIAATTNISLAATNTITIANLADNNLNLSQGAGNSVTFNSAVFTMNTGDTITTAGGAININTTGAATVGGLASNGGAVTLNFGGASSVAGVISGAGSVTKNGAGTLTLTGANTYTGNTTINTGTLAGILGATSALTVNAGATYSLNNANRTIGSLAGAGNVIPGTGSRTLTTGGKNTSTTFSGVLGNGAGTLNLAKIGTSTFTLSGINTYTGTTAINAGTLQLAGGAAIADTSAVTLANTAGATLDLNNTIEVIGSLAGGGATGGNVTLGTGTLITGNNNTSTTYSSVISGGGNLTKVGTGTFTLSGANTYTGATTINAGTLLVNNASALGTAAGGTTVNAGATLAMNGFTVAGEALTLNNGTLSRAAGNPNWNGTVALTGANTLTGAAGTLTLGGVVSGAGSLTKTGAGTVTLGGINTYTGATTISAGILALNATGTIAASSGVANNSAFSIAGNKIIDSMTGAGTTALGANTLTIGDASNTSSAYSGVASGTGGITKTGTGTLTLSGANAYAGATTINAGTLSAANAAALGAAGGVTTVANGATLNVNNVTLTETAITLNTGGALTGTSAAGLNSTIAAANNSSIGTTSAASTLTLNGAITAAGNLAIVGAGDVVATNATNNFSTVNINGANDVNLRDSNGIIIGNGASNLTGNLNVQAGGNVTVNNNISTTGGDITLAGTNFINNAGAGALSASGRWLVYANTHTGNTFGGLDSANQAVWGTAYPTVVGATGNHYVFANSPTVTVTSTDQTKTYGQDGAPIVANAFTATGFIDASLFGNVFTQDTIANALTGSATSTGSPVTANVASYAIDVTPITATTGYTLIKNSTGNLTVNPAVLTVTANNQAKTYGNTFTFAGTEFTNSALQNGEAIGSVSLVSSGAVNNANVNSYAITASNATGGTFSASNYTINYIDGTMTVNPAIIDLSGTRTYNATTAFNAAAFSTINGVLGQTLNLAGTGSVASANAGAAQTLTLGSLALIDNTGLASNYTLIGGTHTGTITQASLNLNAVTGTKTYDGNTNSAGVVNVVGLFGTDNVTNLSQSFASKNVLGVNGSTLNVDAGYTVNDGNGGGNYTVATNATTGTINPLTLIGAITANNKAYDSTPAATIASRSLSGVIGLDDVNYTGGTATFNNKNAGTGKTVTGTGLSLSGVDAGNYTVNTTAVTTADISKADISAVTGITANNKVYDATTAASLNSGAAAFTGAFGGDILTVATATGNFVDANAALGKTVNITAISLGGADSGNYNLLSTTASTTADISQRAITVTANPGQSKVFGVADPLPFAFTVGGLGLVGGDTLTGALDRVVGEVVGSYAINQGSLAASSNYILSYFGNNFNIFVPSATGGGNPRNNAGLVDLNPALGNYTNQQLFVLNVGATAAGVDSEGNQQACEGDPEKLAKDKEFVLMLNYGLNLPKGINTSCDKASL